jgi:hypothetical protein
MPFPLDSRAARGVNRGKGPAEENEMKSHAFAALLTLALAAGLAPDAAAQ